MASIVNVTPASQVANVEVNNRELTVNVVKENKQVDIILETRGDINVDISRSIAMTGVQKIIAGDNITISPTDGTGTVTINSTGGGNSATANYANFAGQVVNSNQPNITSVGNLTGLTLTGNINTPTAVYSDGLVAPIPGNYVGISDSTYANGLFVDDTNVSVTKNTNTWYFDGTGNIILPSNTSSINYANGFPYGGSANVANANYANFAGTAFNVAGSNVSGVVGNATHATVADSANSVAGSNVTGTVSSATTAGTVTTAAQPNITSTGTLTSLSVTGNVTSGNASLGNLVTANYFSGDGGMLANINAANIVGTVPTLISVKNTSGVTLTKGTPVYATGTVGSTSTITVSASRADTSSTMGCIALLSQDLTNNGIGYAVDVGELSGINTSTYLIGEELYVGKTGGLSNTRPTDGTIVQPVGTVVRVNANTGQINVNIWDIVRNPNLDNGNIWVGTTGNGAPIQQVLSTANVGNASYATVADSANSVAGANVSGQVSYAAVANSVAGANVTGTVANANYASFSGNTLNLANGTSFINIPTINSFIYGNVNGTQVMRLSNVEAFYNASLYVNSFATINGNITANYFVGNGSALTGITATTAGTVTTNAQPNITSVGTLTSVSSSGNITAPRFISNIATGNAPFIVSSTTPVANLRVTGNQPNITGLSNSSLTVYTGSTTGAGSRTLVLVNNTNADAPLETAAGITANAANNSITATTFVGALSGTATSATTAGTVTTNAQPNITSVGTLFSLSVTGNITSGNATLGNLVTGNYFSGNGSLLTGITATTAGTVTTNAQPNITSVGTLTSLSVTGNITTGNITSAGGTGNFKFVVVGSGGNLTTAGQVISTVTTGTAPFTVTSTTQVANLSVATAGTAGTVTTNAQPNITSTGTLTSLSVTGNITSGNINGGNLITGNYLSGNGSLLSSITGANVTGTVGNATHATVADSANSVAGANVSGAVAYATTANSVAGANVSGTVSSATTAGTVTTNAQPNITSVGTLTGLNVSGGVSAQYFLGPVANGVSNVSIPAMDGNVNIVSNGNTSLVVKPTGANITGTLGVTGNITGNYFIGNGSALTGITATNSNYANFAGNVVNSAQPNITSVGTLSSLNVSGNIFSNTAVYVGNTSNATGLTNPTIVAKASGATYVQAAIVNGSPNGSADFVAYGDNGSDSGAWADIGFTGSGFNDPTYTITGINDGYFFVQGDDSSAHGGNLVIATGPQGSTKDIVFATGGFSTTNEKMRFINSTNQFYIQPTTAATDTTTGALRVAGGVGIGGDVYAGNVVSANYFVGDGGLLSNITFSGTVSNANYSNFAGTAYSVSGSNVSGAVSFASVANSVAGANVSGAVGLATYATTANSVAGANVSGTVANASYATIAGTAYSVSAGNISGTVNLANYATVANSVAGANVSGAVAYATTANSVAGANVSGTVANATYAISAGSATTATSATTAGTVTTAAQPNITSVGNINNLTTTGTTTLTGSEVLITAQSGGDEGGELHFKAATTNTTLNGPISIDIYQNKMRFWETGGTNRGAYIDLTAAGAGVGSNLLAGGTTVSPGGSNTYVQFNDGSSFGGNSQFTYNKTTNVLSVGNISANGAQLSSLTGANVTGQVGYAAVANSVAVANVTGIGNIATTNYNGNGSTVLAGNGAWVVQSGGSGTPAGSNTSIQFNDAGTLAGDLYLVYNNSTHTLGMSSLNITGSTISGSTTAFTAANVTNNLKITNSSGGYVQTKFIYGPTSLVAAITTDYVANKGVRIHGDGYVDGNLIARGANVDFTGVTGEIFLGNVANINISGGTNGQVLATDGAGNLSFVNQSGGGSSTGFEQTFLMMGA